MLGKVGGGGCYGALANEYSCAPEAQIKYGDLTPYLTYDPRSCMVKLVLVTYRPLILANRFIYTGIFLDYASGISLEIWFWNGSSPPLPLIRRKFCKYDIVLVF
jgi:hypothetical protein